MHMKRFAAIFAVIALLGLPLAAQTVVAPQYSLNINVLGSGVYHQTTAVDNVFGYQLSTNLQLEGDLVVAPGGGVTAYMGGGNYDLCAVKAIDNALAGTTLNCGKFQPFVSVTMGEGRVQQGNSPLQTGPAFMAKVGANLLSSAGSYSVPFVIGYGDFGPKIVGQSNKGFFFYSGFTFGGGNSAAATQAKMARRNRSEAKKFKKMQAKMAQQ